MAAPEEMRRDPRVFLIGEDVAEAGRPFKTLVGLVQEFRTDRIIDTPISEPGYAGIGVGAAMTGMSRDLPSPASPTIETTWPRPRPRSSRHRSSCSVSASRPTTGEDRPGRPRAVPRGAAASAAVRSPRLRPRAA